MRIAFVGKGGSGKTTAAALVSRRSAELGRPVLAIDADVNQHLGQALGADGPPPRALAADLRWLKDHLRGDNPRIAAADQMIKTTPPGTGSRLLDLAPDGELLRRCSAVAGGVRYLVAGEVEADDIGVSCYHAKTGAVELYLNHLVDGPGEYVVVDMTAGADAFASGLFTRFDLTVLVSEPTRRGVGVHRQYARHAAGHGVALRVLGNKADADDAVWLRDQVGDALLGCLGPSAWVRSAERGAVAPVAELEPENLAVLDEVLAALDARERDWAAYHRGTVEFHRRNARAWGDRAVGADLAAQIDPDFRPGPAAVPARPAPPPAGPGPIAAPAPSRRRKSMSLDVPTAVLDAAERDELDDAQFVAVVRESLPYAWRVVAAAADDLAERPDAPFGRHEVPPPSEQDRGQLLRALASDAIRGALERHFGVALAFQNCHRVAAFPPSAVGSPAHRRFTSPRAQVLNQTPELRDC